MYSGKHKKEKENSPFLLQSMTEWRTSRKDPFKNAKGKELSNIELLQELDGSCKEVCYILFCYNS